MLKFSIKKRRGLHFTEGMKLADEIEELEAHLDAVHKVPEEIHSFALQSRQQV